MTRLEAAQNRVNEADAAMIAGDWAAAARDYTLAAEQYQGAMWEEAENNAPYMWARDMASKAIELRDAQERSGVIYVHGRAFPDPGCEGGAA